MRRNWALALVIVLTGALYAPWLAHEFIWDDFVQISENPAVRDGVPVARYFVDRETTSTRTDYNTRIYRPLRNLAFRAIWAASNAAPAKRTSFFLGANLLLYLLGGLLVLSLCRRVTGDARAAALAVCGWLLLPVHAEDVLYASALGDLLSFDLQLLGLLWVIDAVDAERGLRLALGSLASFALAIFVKEAAITSMLIVPAYVLSERRAAIRRGAPHRARVLGLILSHALIGMLYLGIRTAILGRVGQEDVAATQTLRAFWHAPWLLLSYLKSALLPLGHAPDYDYRFPSVAVAALAVLVGGLLFVWSNLKPARGLRFGAWIYVLALAPVLHFVPLWTLMADRFLLVPSVGLALVAAALLARASERWRPALVGILVTGCVLWAAGTLLEARHFQDDETLFAYGVQEVPRSQLSNHNYGLTLLKHGDPKGALKYLGRAIDLGRRDPRVFYHLGLALESSGRYDEASRAVAIAIEKNEKQAGAYVVRARLERHAHDYDAAERSLATARSVGAEPNMVDREAATLATERGDFDTAIRLFRGLAERVGRDPLLWLHLAECEEHVGHHDEARAAVARCLALGRSDSRCAALSARIAAPR